MPKKKSPPLAPHGPVAVPLLPAIVGIAIMLFVVALFNAQLFAAWFLVAMPNQPINEATLSDTYDGQSRLVIPKTGVDAPVVYGMTSFQESAVLSALENGVLHFGDSTPPGAIGNTVLVGHSSSHPWAPGGHGFVFLRLGQLQAGDKIYTYHNGKRYTYQVTDKKVVKPDDISVLDSGMTALMTLIACAPIGTNFDRLVVHAELVEPAAVEDARVHSTGVPQLNNSLIESKLPGSSYDAFQALLARFN